MIYKRPSPSPKYFLLSFSLAFFVFALLFLSMTRFVHPSTPVAMTTDLEQEPYAPTPEDALTVLFMGSATKDAVPEGFVLARFDPEKNRVAVCAFPPSTAVRNNGAMESLSEIYRYGGALYTKEALADTLGFTIDRYLKMDIAAFVSVAEAIGAVEYNLTESHTILQEGVSLTLNAGMQLLNGRKVAALMAKHSADGHTSLQGDLVVAIVNQRMDIALSTVIDKLFEKVINSSDSDISYADYITRLEAAQYMAERKGSPAYAIPASGQQESSGLFTLADTCLARLSRDFS